jgi:hypothetical protein
MSTSEVNCGSSVGTRRERVHLVFIYRKEGTSCWLFVRIIVIMIMNCSLYWVVTFGPFCIHTLYVCPLNKFLILPQLRYTVTVVINTAKLTCCLFAFLIVYSHVRWTFWLNKYLMIWNWRNCVLKGRPPPEAPQHNSIHITGTTNKITSHLSILEMRQIKNCKLTVEGVDR